MCDKAVNTCFFLVFHSVADRYKTQEMCDKAVFQDTFMLMNCPGRYETQKMCSPKKMKPKKDEAVDDCLAALTFFPDWFVTSKMLEKFHDALLTNDDILFFDEDFSKVNGYS